MEKTVTSPRDKYPVHCNHEGQRLYLGTFGTAEEAEYGLRLARQLLGQTPAEGDQGPTITDLSDNQVEQVTAKVKARLEAHAKRPGRHHRSFFPPPSRPLFFSLLRQRFDDASGPGPLGDPTTGVQARVYYSGSYYDAADRLVASVDVGTNGGTPWMRPTSVPDRSDTILVTSYAYNSAGWVQDTVDPAGIDTRTFYDGMGRTTETIVAYTDGVPTNNTNQTTTYTYDGDNNVLTVTAVQPTGTPSQTTQYIYGVTTASGSAINSNDLLAAMLYPDPTTGQPGTTPNEEETYTYNALSQVTTMADRNGTTHAYTYDVLGRKTSDRVTTLGEGVDGSIRRIDTAYDAQGNAYLFTNYADTAGTSIVNQVLRLFNGLGQLTAEYQSTSGPVDLTTTPAVRYSYTEMSGGVNNSRLASITYPSGYVLNYNYGTPGGLNDRISRLDNMSDSTGTLEAYKYLGLSTVVERDHPQSALNLTYISQNGSTGDAGDKYTGLDRFGRIVEQAWIDTLTGQTVENLTYTYDRDSNVTSKNNQLNSAFSEQYTFNLLNELTSFTRNDGESQSWDIDATGNFNSVTTDGTTQDETSNAQNELTGVGSNALTYDNNGNMTTDQNGNTFVYDAWNRLVEAKDSSGNVLITYSYDALGRQITEDRSGTVTTLYYSDQWQVVEEQVSGVTQFRYVWSPVYVNAMVLRDQLNGDGSLNQRLYAVQDANWNVTALVDVNGNVVERYVYSPYGVLTVYDANWNLRTGSQFAWVYNYQGGRFEVLTSLYNFRNRDYSPSLSRWLQNDPEGFPAGDTNFYRFVGNDPLDSADPSGLKVFLVGRPEPWVKHPLGYHYSIVVVSDDGTQVVTYDGAGPVRDFLKDKEGRWIPQRNLKSSLKRLEQCRNPKTGKLELKTDPSKHIFEVDTGGKSFEEEVRALEYVFQNNIWQLPYNVAGPNSNTYAHALLGLAGFEVKPYETTVEIWQPPPPIPGIRYAPQYQTVQTQTPEGAVGWNYNGYYGVTPQTIPGEFRPTIGSLAPQAGPAFQVPAPPPPPAPTPGGGMWTPGGGFWFGFFHFPDDMA